MESAKVLQIQNNNAGACFVVKVANGSVQNLQKKIGGLYTQNLCWVEDRLTVTSSLLLCRVENMRKKAVMHSVPPSMSGTRPPSTRRRTPSTIGRLTCSIRSILLLLSAFQTYKVQSSSECACLTARLAGKLLLFKMDPEQEVREFQREYLDFLDDEVSLQSLSTPL